MNRPELKRNYPKKYLGIYKDEKQWLEPPTWDCDWYWGFGYIGNARWHHHLDGLGKYENVNMWDYIKREFTNFPLDDAGLWKFCEIVETIYKLRGIAEVYNRGGAGYTTNPCSELLKNTEEYMRINSVLLPELFDELYKLFENAK